MTLFRARKWGSAEWTVISLDGEDEDVGAAIAGIIGSALGTSSLHVQTLVGAVWEDLDD